MTATRAKSIAPIDSFVRVYDDSLHSRERYTVVYPRQWLGNRSSWPYLSVSATGLSTYHGELSQRPGKHLGKRVRFADLLPSVQEAIINDIAIDLNDDVSSRSSWRVSYASAVVR